MGGERADAASPRPVPVGLPAWLGATRWPAALHGAALG